ncbi:hypothetical protein J2855_001737 [Agrobacterium tumefaciens]|uniref:HK97 gp10 family phage protein n=1 Tax=Agrobacterium tumefaciens TaxID=358 RepID=UPI000DD09514|nr:HK97 gp10 family phage protein [Agrobacterium tumefaciens]MBP2508102.1 hypothetical protein [Agrobacterium tumefaciens]MBP2517254.1 hypothetical protein [Agrobacterium tumefaciens]MBP2575888.1 hypothetical protein [Agrobacterium tumefaciens]MBP2594244.1 hypothetical protein [Agrobacterium tumefaciens]UXS24195.1 HK97 gp10 family phage protein [Agrobacterium tumefaciens]
MAKLSFGSSIAAWAEKVEGATESVFKESVQEVVEEMQTPTSQGGRMRVDTGFLRASLLASSTAMPTINRASVPTEGQTYSASFAQIEAVIAGSSLGDTLYFGYTAAYAGYREYGANGQPPDAFVRMAAQNWKQIVDRNTARAKAAFGL